MYYFVFCCTAQDRIMHHIQLLSWLGGHLLYPIAEETMKSRTENHDKLGFVKIQPDSQALYSDKPESAWRYHH